MGSLKVCARRKSTKANVSTQPGSYFNGGLLIWRRKCLYERSLRNLRYGRTVTFGACVVVLGETGSIEYSRIGEIESKKSLHITEARGTS
jgi:hypothetical protein